MQYIQSAALLLFFPSQWKRWTIALHCLKNHEINGLSQAQNAIIFYTCVCQSEVSQNFTEEIIELKFKF